MDRNNARQQQQAVIKPIFKQQQPTNQSTTMCRPTYSNMNHKQESNITLDTSSTCSSSNSASSSWPWMQEHANQPLIAQPMAPVSPYDQRPAVQDLIRQHRTKIDEIAQGLQDHPLFEPTTKHDDLWILRFWLSHKNVQKAIRAAKRTLEYRHEYHLDDMDVRFLQPTDENVDDSHPMKVFLTYCRPGGFLTYTQLEEHRGPIAFIDAGCIEANRMVRELPSQFWVDLFRTFSEFSFQWCDYVTRTTGRLTKTVRFFDLSNMRLSEANLENVRRTGLALHQHEDYYPQLLDAIYVSNAPSWIQMPWRMARPILPSRLVSKMDFVQPSSSKRDREIMYKHISHEALPALLGGDNRTPIANL